MLSGTGKEVNLKSKKLSVTDFLDVILRTDEEDEG
jgi:hypothetical protein